MRKACSLATVGAVLLIAGCAGPQARPVPTPAPPSATVSPSPLPTSSAASSATSQPSAEAPSDAPQNLPTALRFHSTKVDGGDFDGATLAGKPALFWFWAPRCPVCRGQIDQVQRIARDNEGKVNVVGVGSVGDAKSLSRFAADAPGMTHLSDESGVVWRHFEVVEQGSFVLLDGKGTKVYAGGHQDSKDLAKRVAAVAR